MGKDLRPVDRVPTEAAAAERFREFNATWGRQYPVLIEVDGGLDEDLSLEAVARGADVLICGVMTVFAEPGALGPGFHRLS